MSTTVPVTVTLPKELVAAVKSTVSSRGFSEFLAEAAQEKLVKLAKKKAHEKLQELPPLFSDIPNPQKYVSALRNSDEKREKQLKI